MILCLRKNHTTCSQYRLYQHCVLLFYPYYFSYIERKFKACNKGQQEQPLFRSSCCRDFFKWRRGDNIGVYTPLCKIQFCKHSNFAYIGFSGNDCYLVYGSILPCKSSASCQDTSFWPYRFTICLHWAWHIHFG